MKKRIFSAFLAVLLCFGAMAAPAAAYTPEQLRIADDLHSMGLFLGTGTSYELDRELTRNEGITLLVRLLGKEEAAKAAVRPHPFTDLVQWAEPYVAYAYAEKLTDGMGPTTFGGSIVMTDRMFYTLCIRALGYRDKSEAPDFSYEDAIAFAHSLSLTERDTPDDSFTRGEAVEFFWKVLHAPRKGSAGTIADSLQKASQTTTGGTSGGHTEQPAAPKALTWKEFSALDAAQQLAYYESFATPEAFFAWQERAKAEYEAGVKVIEVDENGVVDPAAGND